MCNGRNPCILCNVFLIQNVLEPMGLTVQSHAPMIILDINVKTNVTVRITKPAIYTSVVKQLVSSFQNFLTRVSCTLKICNELLMNRHGCINFFFIHEQIINFIICSRIQNLKQVSINQQQGKFFRLDMARFICMHFIFRPRAFLKKNSHNSLLYIFFLQKFIFILQMIIDQIKRTAAQSVITQCFFW